MSQGDKKQDKQSNEIEFKIVGTLDFLPKIGFSSMEEEYASPANHPLYGWWHTYLIKINNIHDLQSLPDNFAVVDNLDSSGKQYIVKDLSNHSTEPGNSLVSFFDKMMTVINNGMTPCIAGAAEYMVAGTGPWLHIGSYNKRCHTVNMIKRLEKICEQVYVCVSVYPVIEVCAYQYGE
jgi:hypothetical protein